MPDEEEENHSCIGSDADYGKESVEEDKKDTHPYNAMRTEVGVTVNGIKKVTWKGASIPQTWKNFCGEQI